MPWRLRAIAGLACSVVSLCLAQTSSSKKSPAVGPPAPDAKLIEPKLVAPPPSTKLTYGVEWRLIRAGTVTIESRPNDMSLKLESAGLVASLFKVNDAYTSTYDDPFCITSSRLDSNEGKRHHEVQVTYDREANKAHYVERDLANNMVLRDTTADLLPCASDVLGALAKLRNMTTEVGKSIQLPVSNGRRTAMVKLEAQERDEVKTAIGNFKAIRYEVFLMNGIVYERKGKVYVWCTDDARHLPIQFRVRMNFPVSSVTATLEKQEGT